MTLSVRNKYFRGGIIFAGISLVFIAAGGYFAFQSYPGAAALAVQRSRGIVQKLIEGAARPSAYVPFWTAAGAAVYSLVSIIFITYFFEKTQSPEILFFGFFVISLSFEFARIMIPLKTVFDFPAMYLITASRILLFGRYFGLFSLFAAGVYAAGLDIQKQLYIFFMSVLAALIIAWNVPVDSFVWDSSLKMLNAYTSMFAMIEGGIIVVTILSFFVSAYTRGSRAYIFIGLGSFLVYAGRNILLASDTWFTPLPGLLCLAVGTWFICARLHQEYLWL